VAPPMHRGSQYPLIAVEGSQCPVTCRNGIRSSLAGADVVAGPNHRREGTGASDPSPSTLLR
jgi:hypothetical protein